MSRAASSLAGKVVKTGFARKVLNDSGNIPIILTNATAATLVIVCASRKLFFHPDISISDELRNSAGVQNETATRMDDSSQFRQQTIAWANLIRGTSGKIMNVVTGNQTAAENWKLDYIVNEGVETPLESTNYFQDGLFEKTSPNQKALQKKDY